MYLTTRAVCVTVALAAPAAGQSPQRPELQPIPPRSPGAHDFDFLLGKRWRIRNRVLADRLAGSQEWREFEAELFDVRSILGGYGNVDRFRGQRDGEPFEASSVRIFDPRSSQWTIFWVDSRDLELTEQVRGRFADGVGLFHGQQLFRGKPIRVRFLWSDVTGSSAHWEQAYFDEGAGEWETNWVMDFSLLSTEGGTERE